MDIVVVYESSYGNTHVIAEAIGEGLGAIGVVEVVPVARTGRELVERADLVVVGGPTHAHGMSRQLTREAAVEAAHQTGSPLTLDPDAEGPGLRDWFNSLGTIMTSAAAFDTRVDLPALVTGRASRGISRQLGRHGFREIAEPMSFLVTKETELVEGQLTTARRWGEILAGTLIGNAARP